MPRIDISFNIDGEEVATVAANNVPNPDDIIASILALIALANEAAGGRNTVVVED